jgi:hypothetical protein
VNECRRGHERNAENTRERRLVRNGKETLIHECRVCVRLKATERRAGAPLNGGLRVSRHDPTNR